MFEITKIPGEFNDKNTFEDSKPFHQLMQEAISPKLNQFLMDYFGESYLMLNPETYLLIEKTIKENFIFMIEIPGIFYRHRTIIETDLFDEALANFVPPKSGLVWQKHKNWFVLDFSDKDDVNGENSFQEDNQITDLNKDQQKANEIINSANIIIEQTHHFASFLEMGYSLTMKEMQLFLEKNASFDLSILSAEGFNELHNLMNFTIVKLLEDLEALIKREP